MAPSSTLPFPASERMVMRVHGYTPDLRPDPEPPRPASLPEAHVLVVQIPHLPEGGHAVDVDFSDLTRREFEQGPLSFLRDKLSACSSTATQLTTTALLELDVVDDAPHGDLPER